MSYFPDTAAGVAISVLNDAGALSLTDRDALNRAGTDYSTSMAARIALMRKTPAGSRTTALPTVLTATDNDKNIVLTGTTGTLGVDGTVADGFRCYLLNTASGVATLSGVTGVPSATIAIPANGFATIFMAAATVYAEVEGATSVSSGSSGPTNATSYTLTQSASSGIVGIGYTLTVAPVGGNWTSSDAITLTLSGSGSASLSNGAGGSLSGNVLAPPSSASASCTVLVTPSASGAIIVTPSNGGGLANPSAVTYTCTASGGSGGTVSAGYPTTPTGTTLLARWDPGVSGSVTVGANGYPANGVSQVADQNGSSNALVPGFTNPSVSTWFPTLVANEPTGYNAVGILAGVPATGLKSVGSWLNGLAGGFTLYGAFLITNTPSGYTNLLQLVPAVVPGPNYNLALNGTSWYWSRWNGSANDATINGTLAAAGQWNNFVLRYTGTTLDAWFNGTKVTTPITGATITPAEVDFGYNNGNPCPFFYFGEAAIYSGAASDADCTTLSNYLTGRRNSSSALATTGTGVSFAMTPAASSGAPSSALSLSLAPSGGSWPSGSITLAASGVSGSFSPATVSPSAGSTTAVSASFIPSAAGLATITATSSAGLPAPAAIYYPVFSGASGTAGTTTVTQSFGNRRPFQRDVASGNPAGFATTWNKGWAGVGLTIAASGPSTAVFARLYDADSAGAATGAGTGTELTSGPVQIWGAVTTGSQSIYPNLPAGPKWFYMDLALNSGFSNPVRVPQIFGVGAITAGISRSAESGFVLPYVYDQTDAPPDLSVIVPYKGGVTYNSGASTSDWTLQNGLYNGTSYNQTTGAMEYCRLMENQLGVVHGIVGSWQPGGNMNDFLDGTGVLNNAFRGSVAGAGNKFRYFVYFDNGGNFSNAQWIRECQAISAWLDQTYTSIPIIKSFSIATGWFGIDGSSWYGYSRTNMALKGAMEVAGIAIQDQFDWNQFIGGHATMLSRLHYVRSRFRMLMSAGDAVHGEYGNNHRGPTFTGQGTWSVVGGAVQIRLPFTHDGGTTLLAYAWTEATNSNPELNTTITEGTATPGQLRALFAVRLAGQRFQRGRLDVRNTTVPASSGSYSQQPGVAIMLDASTGVVIDNTNNAIVLTCASTAGTGTVSFMDGTSIAAAQTQGFTIQFGSDFNLDGQSFAGTCVSLVDNRTDLPGVNYGWPMRAHLDIYAAPPAPAAQTVGFNTPPTAVLGGFLAVSGPAGTGAAASGVQVAINGGAKVAPFGLNLYQDNSWDGLVVAPATASASNTIAVYPVGVTTPSATGTFLTASRASLLGTAPSGTDPAYAGLTSSEAASCIFSFNAMNAGTMWQDAGRTQPITGNLQGVRVWDDELGIAGNRLVPTNASAVPPSLDFAAQAGNGYGTGYNLIGCGPAIVFEPVAAFSYNGMAASGTAPMLAQLNGDFTMLTVFRVHVDQPWTFNGPNGGITLGIGNGVANVYRGSNTLPIPASAWGISDNYGCMVIRYRASTDTLRVDIRGAPGTPFSHVGTAPNTTLGLTSFVMEPSYGWGANMLLQGFNSYISDASTASLLATVAPIWG